MIVMDRDIDCPNFTGRVKREGYDIGDERNLYIEFYKGGIYDGDNYFLRQSDIGCNLYYLSTITTVIIISIIVVIVVVIVIYCKKKSKKSKR